MLAQALGAAAALLAAVSVLLYIGGRTRARALADEVRARVEPYLRRKAAEAGEPADAPTWTRRATPEEIVTYSARLAARLLDVERAGPARATTRDLALAQTQPVGDILVDTGSPTGKLER